MNKSLGVAGNLWNNPQTMNKGADSVIPIHTIQSKAEDFPDILRHIPDPPERLYTQGHSWPELLQRPWVAVVGSRKASDYGRQVTIQLVTDLARAGVVIVSGLAFGVDSLAHQAALDAGGLTVAVLAGGLDRIYPARHYQLARNIVAQGGALVSEYPPGNQYYPQNFIARNRLISGLSQALVITEAARKSGSLHTARFALEQGREVYAVPGNITSDTSVGANSLIKSGAYPLTGSADVLRFFGLASFRRSTPKGDTPAEQRLLDLLISGETDGEALLSKSDLPVNIFSQTLTMLEITGKIRAMGNNKWSLT